MGGDGAERVPLERSPEEQDEEDAFLELYGPWAPLTPTEVAAEMDGFDRPWWVVGGWAIEAATGFRREHEDTDISILASDVEAFVDFLRGGWHVWSNVGGVLRPLGDRWTAFVPESTWTPIVEEPSSQLWLRANATSPWVLDVPLTPDRDGLWINKYLSDHVAPLGEVTWVDTDGIRYLHPEIVLVYKARLRRPKDDPDFAATLPLLTDERRAWMRDALEVVSPDHPWQQRL